MIRPSTTADFETIYNVVNDGASAYKGVIPEDRWHDPYMTRSELQQQIQDGVNFSCFAENGVVLGVMGIQDKNDVLFIRHAYVVTARRNKGIGTRLLMELTHNVDRPILIGTWKAATWAIRFYLKNGFNTVADDEGAVLLRKYWSIPQRQLETSAVLCNSRYEEAKSRFLSPSTD